MNWIRFENQRPEDNEIVAVADENNETDWGVYQAKWDWVSCVNERILKPVLWIPLPPLPTTEPVPAATHRSDGEAEIEEQAKAFSEYIIPLDHKGIVEETTWEEMRERFAIAFKRGAEYQRQQGTDAISKPKVVCFCGSTRFAEYFMTKRWEFEKQGIITFGINILPDNYFAEGNSHGAEQEGVKDVLDELHKRKIDLSDEVFVLNVGGYIGESTRNEINYAIEVGKPVQYLEPLPHKPIINQ